MNGIDAAHQIIIGDAQITITLDASTIQATALVAVIPRGVVFVEVDAVVFASHYWIWLSEAERTIVRTTIAVSVAITELIAVAQCVCLWKVSITVKGIVGNLQGDDSPEMGREQPSTRLLQQVFLSAQYGPG